ncbi:hypothetical protein BFW01_g465 [Lasiodiplodia theobromae]|nr:hypothetical protein BFW01_g465 [Lasiodiplodia theobromae]
MCGITASVALSSGCSNGHDDDGTATRVLTEQLQKSLDVISHRGPDDSGMWLSPDGRIGLGHCRLSINDITPSGHQPLHSDCGELHAVVNGEIYDHDRLRAECATQHGYTFSGESDSELVLALYKIHGAPGMFEHLRGEFAFVLVDTREGSRRVIVGRDRFGIKPLMWTVVTGRLLLAAEAKAFLPMGWQPEWDVAGIVECGWALDDRTLFKDVRKLLPGHWMEVTEERGIEMHRYWDAEYGDKSKAETRSVEEMILGVRERLIEAIRLRLRADVPVGVYLSGGIDSSAVAGIVTQLAREEHVKLGSQEATRVACFSVQFPKASGYDESSIAERTAEWLGVEVIKKDVDEATLARDFADTAYHSEHHHFDMNSVAKFALSSLTRERGFKVVLTGEGADEHFAGYPFFPAEFLREPDSALPDSVLATDHELRGGMQRKAEAELQAIMRMLGAKTEGSSFAGTLLVGHPPLESFSPWVREQHANMDRHSVIMNSHSPEVLDKMQNRWHPLHSALYMWTKSTFPNVLLACLGDRTDMAHSIESRTPFLDHHLAEYVNALPPSLKIAYNPPAEGDHADVESHGPVWKASGKALQSLSAKWVLREAVRPYITDELYRRKKVPFLAPSKWPQGGPLHRMFENLLSRDAVEQLGFFEYSVVEDALGRAFGDEADPLAFRTLAYVGAWVTLSKRFGVKKAGVC